MAKFNCFTGFTRKNKGNRRNPSSGDPKTNQRMLLMTLYNDDSFKSCHVDKVVVGNKTPVVPESYEDGGQEDDGIADSSAKVSNFDALDTPNHDDGDDVGGADVDEDDVDGHVSDDEDDVDDGHVSDPGVERPGWVESPKLKRSCSSLETREVLSTITSRFGRPNHHEAVHEATEFFEFAPESPESTISRRSADGVMLRKYSSMQILPSRSKKLWWKLFVGSHRNLHNRLVSSKSVPSRANEANRESGYASDIQAAAKSSSPRVWPRDKWLAFSTESSSSFKRVDEWVQDLDVENSVPAEEDSEIAGGFTFQASPEAGKSPTAGQTAALNVPEEIVFANNVIRSLNKASTVANISSIGLNVVPIICHLNNLKSVDLSNNFIVRITPGSLPKGLHALDLSKNRINVVEGLRDMSRLRVLDLSYNRISRIGQGLSNCALIKELYVAGNKISDVEGLHRLLKLTVLDLSFNKITTTKAIGQLVANYNSLLALSLLGNPIQSNIGDERLRKAVWGLLPKLVYFNKKSMKPQRAREIVARALLSSGGNSSNSLNRYRRTTGKRSGGGGGGGGGSVGGGGSSTASPTIHRGSSAANKHKRDGIDNDDRSKNRNRHQLRHR